MRVGKLIKRSVLILVMLLVTTLVVLYILSSQVPEEYNPLRNMSFEEREQAATQFASNIGQIEANIKNKRPFTFELTQADANRYLASMDEIAFLKQNVEAGTISKAMAKAGVDAPAMSIRDGLLTFMVSFVEYGKVLSLEISVVLKDESIFINMTGASLGKMPIPLSLAKSLLHDILPKSQKSEIKDSDVIHAALQVLADALLDALGETDGKVLPRQFKQKGNVVRVELISITDGKLTIKFKPL